MSGPKNVYFNVFLASQIRANDKGFLSRDITVRDLFAGQKRHPPYISARIIYQRSGSCREGNSINLPTLVVMQREINIAIGDTAPHDVFFTVAIRVSRWCVSPYGGIGNSEELQKNLEAHCIPEDVFDSYDEFLEERRKLIVAKIRDYYFSL